MWLKYLLAFFSAFCGAAMLVALLRRLAKRYSLLMQGDIPLVGGIAIGLALFLVSGFLSPIGLSAQLKGIVASSLIMLIFGIIDDLKELSVPWKFLVEIIATSVLVSCGVKTQIVYIGQAANILITFIWVVGISNAFNHLDVLDGLAGGSALIVGLAFGMICFLNLDAQNMFLALALSGAVLGFLLYNLPPAKVYLGNSGSHFLGFIFASLALAVSYAPLERKVALLAPLFILGFPIFDTAFLILVRIKQNKSVLKKSDDHLALRFIKLGYSKKKALAAMLGMALLFSLSGLVISRASNMLGWLVVIAVFLFSLATAYRMSRSQAAYRCLEKGYLF